MATAFEPKRFSDQEWRGMLAEDAQAFKTVAIVLATVVTVGFLAVAGTVWLVL